MRIISIAFLLVGFVILGCEASEAELTQWVESAIHAIRETPEQAGMYATPEAAAKIAGYRSRMEGKAVVLGWNDANEGKVVTVRFEEGDAFWMLVSQVQGEMRITAIQPVDLKEGRPTL